MGPHADYRLEDLPKRIRSKIQVNPETGCWEWQAKRNKGGYGNVRWEGRHWMAHRVVYTILVGPIPDGLTLDHVKAWGCKSRACCWPAHLEPVTLAVNTLRGDSFAAENRDKTHCPQGHEFTEANTYLFRGSRICLECKRQKCRDSLRERYRTDPEYAARKREQVAKRRRPS